MCPLHDDVGKQSFSVNMSTGKWKCFVACGGGDAKTFAKRLGVSLDKELKTLKTEVREEKPTLYVAPKLVKEAVARFWGKKGAEARKYLEKRGIKTAVMKQFELGLEEDGSRIWIPVKDFSGGYANVRRYDFLKISSAKFLHYQQADEKAGTSLDGFGINRFWPAGVVETNQTILLLEGEPDTLLAHSLGLTNAVCTTGGAGHWDDKFTWALEGKKVLICYDIDAAGKKGANDVVHALALKSTPIVLKLPLVDPPTGDFTDYINACKGDVRPFLENVLGPALTEDYSVSKVSLLTSTTADNFDKTVAIRAAVAGKDLTPFMIPDKVKVVCRFSDSSAPCQGCSLKSGKGETELTVPITSAVVLGAPESTDKMVAASIQEWLQIPGRCPGNQVRIQTTKPMWEVSLVNDLDSDAGREEGEYVTRRAYSLVSLAPNVPYDLKALATRDPKTQAALLEVLEAEGKASSLETFTPEGKEHLLKIWEI